MQQSAGTVAQCNLGIAPLRQMLEGWQVSPWLIGQAELDVVLTAITDHKAFACFSCPVSKIGSVHLFVLSDKVHS